MIRVTIFILSVLYINCDVKAQQCPPGLLNCTISANNELSFATTQEMTTHTSRPITLPKPMNMLAEEHMEGESTKTVNSTEEPKGRALNFTSDEYRTENKTTSNNTKDTGDLSDVTISDDDDEEEHEMQAARILSSKEQNISNSTPIGMCEKGGLTYENGEKLELGCDSLCTCTNGKMDCVDRCKEPYFRKGKKISDPLCTAKNAEDPCCSILVCAADTETEPLEICSIGNKTYNRGETFNMGCEEVCICDIAGKASCKPRCPIVNKTSESCVEVQDPNDSCCKTVLCDVTLDDHDADKEDDMQKYKLVSAKLFNTTTVELKFYPQLPDKDTGFIEGSDDKKKWKTYKIRSGKYVEVMDGTRYLKLENENDVTEITGSFVREETKLYDNSGCVYKEKKFKFGEEYNDNCTALCVCRESGMKCLKIECPTYFGVDVLDPNCIEWETIPPNFVPSPPHCCPNALRCKSNGSCVYEGQAYQNWQQLPTNVTGCEKRCYCEMGNVECQNICPPVPALPPPTLPCLPYQAMLDHLPGDECCKYWACNPSASKETGHKHNETVKMTEKPNLDPITVSNAPSKNLGPLMAYANNNESRVTLDTSQVPTKDENPFYHKNKEDVFLGPYNPYYKKPFMDKSKPPPVQTNYIPNQEIPSKKPQVSKVPQIHVHGQGTSDELLQFINQHPEIANYPSGSVLEIHSIPSDQKPINPLINGRPQQNVPYLAPPGGQLPPGITLEHILQEIHKNPNANPSQGLSFPPQYNNNGHILIAPQSGHVLPNATYAGAPGFPGNFHPNLPGLQPQDDISVHTLEAIDAHTVRLAFMVPPVIVGLHGRVEVRYTSRDNPDLESWQLQVFAPPNDLIATPQLEFDLLELKPDTEYRIKITITLRDLHNTPTSRIYKIRTPKDITTTSLPPMIPIEPELGITDINATWVTVVWRKFTEYELQFIDGVQLRYKEIDGKIYDATSLIHRSVTSYTLENLKPNTKYEIGIFFIPFPGQLTELHTERMLHFTTANEIDTYGFNVTLDIAHIKSTSVEISWAGVPYPEDKYVNIYRAIYQSDSGKEDQSTFKIAKRDSPTKTIIMDLKPGTRYRLWLEVYLTNGKIKTSNVQDFITKPRAAPVLGAAASQQGEHREHTGDYYGPLVIVAILASIAIMSTLILLLILVRRHNQNKAAITPPPRVSQSATYDNPTYKVEIQQETMGL